MEADEKQRNRGRVLDDGSLVADIVAHYNSHSQLDTRQEPPPASNKRKTPLKIRAAGAGGEPDDPGSDDEHHGDQDRGRDHSRERGQDRDQNRDHSRERGQDRDQNQRRDRFGAEIQIDVEAPWREELTVKSGTGAHEGTNATRRKLDVRRKIEPSERVI